MHFNQPLLLIGLVAVLVPILIHLFNFRRYKTYYFSNVKMLQDIAEKTKRESQLKHLIVLCLRVLAIAALVFAFAQPYIPTHSQNSKSGNLVTIYVDNSFSMDGNTPEGTLFYDGVGNARKIINNFQYTDEFVLYNNDFTAQQSRRLNKEEALKVLDNWTTSPNSKSWSDLLTFEKNAGDETEKRNLFHYYISDFQKNNFDFTQYKREDNSSTFLINMPAKETSNVSIDSCWFLSPVFREGQQVTLTVRVRNCGDGDVVKLPLKLYVNGEQKAMAAIDIAADSYADHQLNYTLTSSGIQCAYLEVEDLPITFDNRLFFTYNVSDATNVTIVYQDKPNQYLTALYAKDSVFSCQMMPAGKINYDGFKKSSLIVMSEVESVSSGLADELTKYVNNGGTLLVFPSAKMDFGSWNSFLGNINCSQYGNLVTQELKIGSINTESAYFKGSLQGNGERLDFPTAKQYFTFANPHVDEAVMTFENSQPALFVNNAGSGRVILSAVAANDDFGNIHKHALFFIPMHNIGIRSVMQQQLYNIIGKNHSQAVSKSMEGKEDVLRLKLQGGESEYIPEQRNLGNETMLYFNDQLDEAGIYDVMLDGARQTAVAFNYDRRESQLKYYTEEEIEAFIKEQGDSAHIELIDAAAKDITQNVAETLHGHALWRWFVLMALLCLAAEIAILRLWK